MIAELVAVTLRNAVLTVTVPVFVLLLASSTQKQRAGLTSSGSSGARDAASRLWLLRFRLCPAVPEA